MQLGVPILFESFFRIRITCNMGYTYVSFREPVRIGPGYLTAFLHKMSTISQIARKLGVSVSTVSAVINKRKYVSDAMRARIERALVEFNYRPDHIARSLRTRETNTIGLIVPDLTNTFYAHLMRGAEDYLSTLNYRLIVADSREDWLRQRDFLLLFSGRTTDGIILVPSFATDEQIASIPTLVRSTPLVYVDRSPLKVNLDSVTVDNAGAAFEATQHLLKLGHRRIGIVTEPLNLLNAADRVRGYKQALRAAKLEIDPWLIRAGDNGEDSGYWRAMDFFQMNDPPTAVLVCNNRMTLGTLTALSEMKLHCPGDVSIIGFDDFDSASLIDPPLTVVRQPADELGTAAAKALLKRLRGPNRAHCEHVMFPTQLVVRGSTAAPRTFS